MRNALPYLTAALLFSSTAVAQNLGTIEGEALDALNLSPLVGWEVDVIQGDFQIETKVDVSVSSLLKNYPRDSTTFAQKVRRVRFKPYTKSKYAPPNQLLLVYTLNVSPLWMKLPFVQMHFTVPQRHRSVSKTSTAAK